MPLKKFADFRRCQSFHPIIRHSFRPFIYVHYIGAGGALQGHKDLPARRPLLRPMPL
jgi:hypothetical protein